MAKRGPKPKPHALRILQGNPSRRPIPRNRLAPKVGLPRSPRGLTPDGRKLWAAMAKQLTDCGVATQLDAVAFELLVRSMLEYQEAIGQVARTGAIWLEPGEGKIPKFQYSPYWCVGNRSFKNIITLLREFGMTPSARTGVSATPIVAADEDPSARYFGEPRA